MRDSPSAHETVSAHNTQILPLGILRYMDELLRHIPTQTETAAQALYTLKQVKGTEDTPLEDLAAFYVEPLQAPAGTGCTRLSRRAIPCCFACSTDV